MASLFLKVFRFASKVSIVCAFGGVACYTLIGNAYAVDDVGAATCKGFVPPLAPIIYKTNWNNIFPITVAGVEIGRSSGAKNPYRMVKTTPCICPSRFFGVPSPGIMVTFFQPKYVAEIEKEPGCVKMLAAKLLPSLISSRSGMSTDTTTNSEQKRQVHLFEFPLFTLFEQFKMFGCLQGDLEVFDTGFVSEIDAPWQFDGWASIFSPESALFANPVAHMACAADAVGAAANQNVDPLFWCEGHRLVYPYSGRNNTETTNELANLAILGKFVARHTRLGVFTQTIGREAICHPIVNPVWNKSQWRVDPLFPSNVGWGRPIVFGQSELLWRTVGNYPGRESYIFNLWRAVQCCVRF